MDAVEAVASPNIALAKYWGKRDVELNLPVTGSLSVTLEGLETRARVALRHRPEDRVCFAGTPAPPVEARRISRFLQLFRELRGEPVGLDVDLASNFPVAAGLASSASTFAALGIAAAEVLGLSLSDRELSILARRGSGSAARSVFGGWVEWHAGAAADGTDSFAEPIAPSDWWDLSILVAVTDPAPKAVGSTDGMRRSEASPYFAAWRDSHAADLEELRAALQARDLPRLGATMEHNCLKMHALALSVQPPLLYWRPATVAVMQRVLTLRGEGREAWFTIDAGPQVKVLCPSSQAEAVAAALAEVSGVKTILRSRPGAGPRRSEARA